MHKTDWITEKQKSCGGRRSCRPKLLRRRRRWWRSRFMSMRSSAASASSAEKSRRRREKPQQCHVLLHHWIGLEDSGPASDEGSHMPLGCVPFSRAQLASTQPCNYSYSICAEGIVRSSVALRNYGGNNKTAAVTTAICKLQEAANFPLRGR